MKKYDTEQYLQKIVKRYEIEKIFTKYWKNIYKNWKNIQKKLEKYLQNLKKK